jgi:hypothetical protein
VGSLPRIYAVLQEMGNAIPLQLKAILATRIAEEYHGTEEELVQLRQGLGLNEPSEEFWAPLGKMYVCFFHVDVFMCIYISMHRFLYTHIYLH